METGAQARCACGKLTSKSGQLHQVQPSMFRCTSSSASFTSARQESDTRAKQHRITVMCNVQKKSYGVWALSHLMRERCHRPQRKPMYLMQQNNPWSTITVNQHPCTAQGHLRREGKKLDGTAQEEEETFCLEHAQLLCQRAHPSSALPNTKATFSASHFIDLLSV